MIHRINYTGFLYIYDHEDFRKSEESREVRERQNLFLIEKGEKEQELEPVLSGTGEQDRGCIGNYKGNRLYCSFIYTGEKERSV